MFDFNRRGGAHQLKFSEHFFRHDSHFSPSIVSHHPTNKTKIRQNPSHSNLLPSILFLRLIECLTVLLNPSSSDSIFCCKKKEKEESHHDEIH
jgi:hypothetical protein